MGGPVLGQCLILTHNSHSVIKNGLESFQADVTGLIGRSHHLLKVCSHIFATQIWSFLCSNGCNSV